MMRPIDADALEKRLEETRNAYEVNGYFDNYVFGFDDAWKHIKDAPTIEAEPVRHATLLEGDWYEVYCSWGTCSKCGADNLGHARYCNECGARLDLEVE